MTSTATRLTTPYVMETPLLRVAVTGPTGTIAVIGVVDSGADSSLLPKSVADRIGIPVEELEAGEGAELPGGVHIPTWTTTAQLTGQVLADVTNPEDATPWGPQFRFIPEFAKDTIAMFGRADLFEKFVITFDQTNNAPLFHLDRP